MEGLWKELFKSSLKVYIHRRSSIHKRSWEVFYVEKTYESYPIQVRDSIHRKHMESRLSIEGLWAVFHP